jgi:hypothetical protein
VLYGFVGTFWRLCNPQSAQNVNIEGKRLYCSLRQSAELRSVRMRKKKPKPIALINEDQVLRQQEAQTATAKEMIMSAREMRNQALEMRRTLSTTKKKLP